MLILIVSHTWSPGKAINYAANVEKRYVSSISVDIWVVAKYVTKMLELSDVEFVEKQEIKYWEFLLDFCLALL